MENASDEHCSRAFFNEMTRKMWRCSAELAKFCTMVMRHPLSPVRQTLSIRIEERCAWLFKRARCIAAATGHVSIPIEKLLRLHSRTPDGTTNVLHELCGRHLVTLRSCRYMQLYECYRMLIWVQLFDTISGVSWSCHLFCHKSAGMTVSPPLSDRAWTPQSHLRNQGRRAGSGSTMTETAV